MWHLTFGYILHSLLPGILAFYLQFIWHFICSLHSISNSSCNLSDTSSVHLAYLAEIGNQVPTYGWESAPRRSLWWSKRLSSGSTMLENRSELCFIMKNCGWWWLDMLGDAWWWFSHESPHCGKPWLLSSVSSAVVMVKRSNIGEPTPHSQNGWWFITIWISLNILLPSIIKGSTQNYDHLFNCSYTLTGCQTSKLWTRNQCAKYSRQCTANCVYLACTVNQAINSSLIMMNHD